MKLLITGIPGTGKTTIGEYLETNYGFLHLNVEKDPAKLKDFIEIPRDKKVITWGFIPGFDDDTVKIIQSLGYKMIWFDGNRPAARRAFCRRKTVSVEALDIQMKKVENMDISVFNPIIMDTFDKNGNFLEQDIIVSKLMSILSQS